MPQITHIEEATQRIKAEAIRLGFSACGIARAEAAPKALYEGYEAWLAQGFNGEMSYLERNADPRQDPRVLVPGTRCVPRL